MNPLYGVYAVIVAFLWGANFVAVKVGLTHFPPYFLVALRFAVVVIIMMPFYWRRTIDMKFLFAMSVILGTVHFALLFGAMGYGLDVATSAITVQLGVPFSCVLSAIFFNDRLGAWRSGGLMVSFMGIAMIAGTPHVVEHFVPFLMAMAAAFCWAVANVMMKRKGSVDVLEMLTWMSLLTIPQLMLLSLLVEKDHWQLLLTATPEAVASVLFSAIGSTIVAYGLWYYLLKRAAVSQITPFNLLVPVFGIALGQLLFHETLAARTILGGLITISGVAIIVARRPKLASLGKILTPRQRS